MTEPKPGTHKFYPLVINQYEKRLSIEFIEGKHYVSGELSLEDAMHKASLSASSPNSKANIRRCILIRDGLCKILKTCEK